MPDALLEEILYFIRFLKMKNVQEKSSHFFKRILIGKGLASTLGEGEAWHDL